MAASTGTPLYPGSATFPGSTTFPGGGTLPVLHCLLAFDDVTDPTPSWVDVSTRVRSISTDRGRGSELDEFDGATATVEFNNSDRFFNPDSAGNVRPMNRLWLYWTFSGETLDEFYGYVERCVLSYDTSGDVGVATLSCADEFKRLNLQHLPTTDPPRDSYSGVIEFDQPTAYWHMDDPGLGKKELPAIGNAEFGIYAGSMTDTKPGAIVGDPNSTYAALVSSLNSMNLPPLVNQGDGMDTAGIADFTVEFWLLVPSAPGALISLAMGPLPASGLRQWIFQLNTSLQITFAVHTVVSTYTATSSGISLGAWHHVVGRMTSDTATVWVDGAQAGTVATSNAIISGYFAGTPSGTLSNNSGVGIGYDELAFYRYNLSDARIAAHYTAGRLRGFPTQAAGSRIAAVLDAVASPAVRSLGAGVFNIAPRYMRGQSPLEEIRTAVNAEAGDAAFFSTRGNALKFLPSDHRASAPYNVTQVTYGDVGGSERPMLAAPVFDDSDSFLYNVVNVTREGGLVQTTRDTASIGKYDERTLPGRDGLALTSDADAATVAAALLAKYKDPFQRVVSIQPKMADADTCLETLRLDLMDRIRVLATPPGGGSRIDQTVYVQSRNLNAKPGEPPSITLGVSPL